MKDEQISRLAPSYDGSIKARCPQCSAKRKKKTDTPLSITRQGSEVVWYCHHCQFKGFYDEARRSYD